MKSFNHRASILNLPSLIYLGVATQAFNPCSLMLKCKSINSRQLNIWMQFIYMYCIYILLLMFILFLSLLVKHLFQRLCTAFCHILWCDEKIIKTLVIKIDSRDINIVRGSKMGDWVRGRGTVYLIDVHQIRVPVPVAGSQLI